MVSIELSCCNLIRNKCSVISGAPVYISNPHFYQSDPKLLAEVEGLKPDRDLHETYFKIQPVRYILIKLSRQVINLNNLTETRCSS